METPNNACPSRKTVSVPSTIYELCEGNNYEAVGGLFSDSKFSWLGLGPYLQVFSTNSSKIKSIWCFGAIVKEPNVKVVSVCELHAPYKAASLLVVGLKYGSHGGMICIYNFLSAKVLRAIEIPEEVTSLHVINSGYQSTFPGPLSGFDGIISVGTVGGAVYIIDLCKEFIDDAQRAIFSKDICNELQPAKIEILSQRDINDLERHKYNANQSGCHLAILLNEMQMCSQHFELKTPQGNNVILAAKAEVTVSTLHYAPQLCSLFIGYNFGALQLWNFLSMSLEYTSPVYEEKIPVSSIAIQEPIDDPRALCYFWAIFSCSGRHHDVFPLAVLYSLNYESKDYHDGYGCLYQNLEGCVVRFQSNLQAIDPSICESPLSASCIRLQSLSKGINPNTSSMFTPAVETYSLCMMAWNVYCEEHKYHTFMSLFDLNQWYKEQMPCQALSIHSRNYMSNILIADSEIAQYSTLDALIDPQSIDLFVGAQKYEEHYSPSSISYEISTLSEVNIAFSKKIGAQRLFFKELEDAGPLILLHPTDMYISAKSLGLAPIFLELYENASVQEQCEALLSIALERQMLQWLCKCATSWANGTHRSQGLSLEFLLHWAWERTRTLKHNTDKHCRSLFDYSGVKLDGNYHTVITECRIQFCTLKDLYSYIIKNCDSLLLQGDIVKQRLVWLEKNYAYFNVIGWMINLGILPENEHTYPVRELSDFYRNRRRTLQATDNNSISNTSYLFIDFLTSHVSLRNDWRVNGDGEYPPDSLQTLLHCYFNNDLMIKTAHIIVAYTLLDLVMHMKNKNETVAATILKFPQIFDLSLNVTKTIQACWRLDHGELEYAVNQLSTRSVQLDEIPGLNHLFIVNVLKAGKQYHLALSYLKSRNLVAGKENIQLMIQLLVRNKLLFEALSIERRHGDKILLEAFFVECFNANFVMELLNFNFAKDEEKLLMDLLDATNYPKREEFKTIYFVRRGRFLDFYMRCNQHASHRYAMPPLAKNTLDSVLPQVTKKVIETCLDLKSLNYTDTKPLSAYACSDNERARFQNNFMKACIVNCKDKWSSSEVLAEDDYPFMRTPLVRNKYNRKHVVYPKKVNVFTNTKTVDDTVVEQPTKRLRRDISLLDNTLDTLDATTIETTHILRYDNSAMLEQYEEVRPHSILKHSRSRSNIVTSFDENAKNITQNASVHFTGLSSTSSATSYVSLFDGKDTPIKVTSQCAKESSSTTTDYCSMEPSSDESNQRKRKLREEDQDEPFIEPLILRSRNISTRKLEDHSSSCQEVECKDLIEHSTQTGSHVENEEEQKDASSHVDNVFVFTGNDMPSYNSRFISQPRPSYQNNCIYSSSNKASRINEQSISLYDKSVSKIAQGNLAASSTNSAQANKFAKSLPVEDMHRKNTPTDSKPDDHATILNVGECYNNSISHSPIVVPGKELAGRKSYRADEKKSLPTYVIYDRELDSETINPEEMCVDSDDQDISISHDYSEEVTVHAEEIFSQEKSPLKSFTKSIIDLTESRSSITRTFQRKIWKHNLPDISVQSEGKNDLLKDVPENPEPIVIFDANWSNESSINVNVNKEIDFDGKIAEENSSSNIDTTMQEVENVMLNTDAQQTDLNTATDNKLYRKKGTQESAIDKSIVNISLNSTEAPCPFSSTLLKKLWKESSFDLPSPQTANTKNKILKHDSEKQPPVLIFDVNESNIMDDERLNPVFGINLSHPANKYEFNEEKEEIRNEISVYTKQSSATIDNTTLNNHNNEETYVCQTDKKSPTQPVKNSNGTFILKHKSSSLKLENQLDKNFTDSLSYNDDAERLVTLDKGYIDESDGGSLIIVESGNDTNSLSSFVQSEDINKSAEALKLNLQEAPTEITLPARRSTRRSKSLDVDVNLNYSPRPLGTRTRRSSMEEAPAKPAKRKTRTKSADAINEEPLKRRTRSIALPAIEEEHNNVLSKRRQRNDDSISYHDSPSTRMRTRASVTRELDNQNNDSLSDTKKGNTSLNSLQPRRSNRLHSILTEVAEDDKTINSSTPKRLRPRRNSSTK